MPTIGRPLITFARITSTQTWARAWADLGAAEGLVVQALEQTQGRGRGQRSWWSPAGGGLYLSILLRPTIAPARAAHITMLVALAVIDTCTDLTGLPARPKWPNDVLLHGRKLAGILSEQSMQDGRLRYNIVGVGVNVNTDFQGTPLADIATSLAMASRQTYSLDRVRDTLLAKLTHRYRQWQQGVSPHAAWRRHLEPIGRRVRVQRPGQPDLIGKAIDATPEGALQIRDDTGGVHTIWAGDVVPTAQ